MAKSRNTAPPRRRSIRVLIAAGLIVGSAASACSSPPTCAELDATAIAASERYDAAVTEAEIADAKAEFDDAIGELINLDC